MQVVTQGLGLHTIHIFYSCVVFMRGASEALTGKVFTRSTLRKAGCIWYTPCHSMLQCTTNESMQQMLFWRAT